MRESTHDSAQDLDRLPLPPGLEGLLLDLLSSHSSFTEYQLMKTLVAHDYPQLAPDLDPLVMFQTHFSLFHWLYQLQSQWLNQGIGQLDIHTLKIALTPLTQTRAQSPPGLVVDDPLRTYYMDLTHLLEATHQDVEALLAQFWQRYAQTPTKPPSETRFRKACETLALSADAPLEPATVLHQFRRLCQQHHPDKGGDAAVFRRLCQAKTHLLQALTVDGTANP